MNIKNNKFVFSERLLKLRRHLKWTQKKLALESKINEHTISRWVKKKFEPNDESIRKISEATGCNPRYLSGDETTMFPVNNLVPVELDKYAEKQKERKLLERAIYVMGSETDYGKALSHNINVFYRAVKTEEANRRKGDRRKHDVSYEGEDRRKGERRHAGSF